MLTLDINGKKFETDAEPDTPLLWVLRDHLGLTGSKYGCGEGQCGACTVLLDGAPARSCITYAVACEGAEVTTIEGLEHVDKVIEIDQSPIGRTPRSNTSRSTPRRCRRRRSA